jgi:hypothetical protein
MRAADDGQLYKKSGCPDRKIDAWNNEDENEYKARQNFSAFARVLVVVLVLDIRIFDINSCLL